MMQQRIRPIETPFSAQLQKSFDVVMPPGIPPLNIFQTVANNERVLSRMVRGGPVGQGVRLHRTARAGHFAHLCTV